MKNNKYFLVFFCILFLNYFLLYEEFTLSHNLNEKSKDSNKFQTKIKVNNVRISYTSLTSPLEIINNSGFLLYNFSGSGTLSDPIIIENLNIGNSTNNLISIRNTDLNFVIRNSYLNGMNGYFKGIILNNVTNCLVLNNSITMTSIGISLKDSYNNTIMNNTIFENSKNSISFYRSSNNSIIGNELYDNTDSSLYLTFLSNYNLISSNYIFNSGNIGIYLYESNNNNVIVNNTIYDNYYEGIYINNGCQKNEILKNNLYNNLCGLNVFLSTSNKIDSNIIFNNDYGLKIDYYGYNTLITNNIIMNNSYYGIILGNKNSNLYASYCHVTWNILINNNFESHSSSSQAYDHHRDDNTESSNIFQFNYWSDWITPDEDNNRIVDNPYVIDGSYTKDYSPLVSYLNNVSIHYLTKPTIFIPKYNQNSRYVYIYWGTVSDSLKFPVKYSLSYSIGTENIWIDLVKNCSNTYFKWNETHINSGCYRLKITAISEGGLTVEEISNYFPLKMDHTLSIPQIISPDINKTLSENVTIQWSPAIDNCYYSVTYNLSYSVDGGNSWILLCSSINTTSFEWDTTSVSNGDNYKFRIVAISSSGLITTMITEKTFTINNDAFQLFIKKIPFLDIFFILFIILELLSLNFLIKFIRKKKNSS